MAEVAAGALVAEQIVSTGVEAGAAVTLAKPTQPLTAVLSQIATTPAKDDSLALARSHHTTTVIGNKAYIFGGKKQDGQLCSNDVHAVLIPGDESPDNEYACHPAVGIEDGIPLRRFDHAACARRDTLIIHGGQGEDGQSPDEETCLWIWDSTAARWSTIKAVGKAPGPRSNHYIFFDQWNDHLVLHGGLENGKPSTETWRFDFTTRMWTQLPSAPAPSLTATFVDTILYSISGDSDVHGSIHFMKTESPEDHPSALEWTSVDFPTNPLTPGPRPRVGSALIPVATGYGRHYLLYLLGSRKDAGVTSSDETYTEDHPFYSDMWSIQVSSADFSPSRIKDAIRDNLPFTDSGAFKWYELEIAPTELTESSGKVHPGPRGFFGADACLDGKGVVLWGGLNAKGETEGDGWLLKIG